MISFFANEAEAEALTGKQPEQALNEIAEMCEIAVVKLGKDGSLIKKDGEITMIEAIPAKAIDTTGAGDCYAAGFLYGITNNLTIKEAGNLASALGAKIVQKIGARLTKEEINALN